MSVPNADARRCRSAVYSGDSDNVTFMISSITLPGAVDTGVVLPFCDIINAVHRPCGVGGECHRTLIDASEGRLKPDRLRRRGSCCPIVCFLDHFCQTQSDFQS